MLETERAGAIFVDAQVLYADALEELDRGNLRNAAEKAWGATKRATDALVLARTGREPRSCRETMFEIRTLSRGNPSIKELEMRYCSQLNTLYTMCFCDGMCEPEDDLIADIWETLDYIHDARSLAGGQA